MRIVSANITGSLILNGVDVTDSLVSSSANSGSVSSKLDSLQSSTSSLNSFTSSINTTIKTKLDSETVISGSAQVLITGTTGYSTFSSSISTSIGSLSSSVATTTNTLSSSLSSSIGSLSSSVATTTSNLSSRVGSVETKSGSYATTGSNTFIGTENITGNLTVTGSIIVSSGSAVYNSSLNLTDTSSLTLNSGSSLYVYDTGIISGTFKGSISGSLPINGNVTITGSVVSTVTSLVSGSSQISITGTTGYSTFSSSVSTSIGSLSSSIATTTSGLSASIDSLSSSIATTTGNLSSSVATTTSGLASRIGSVETKSGSYATTGSNIFVGSQVITGSLYITTDLVVQGCSCLQNITASAVSIGTNVVMLNTATPAVRFAGISVQDSGSNAGVTGSIFWDGLCNKWIYSNPSTVGYSGGMLLSGPRNTSGTIGNESPLTCNVIAKSGGGDHIYDSCIIDDGTTVCVNANLIGTGTACFSGAITNSASTTDSYVASFSQTNTTADHSFGLLVRGGTSSSDVAFRIQNAAAGANFLSVLGSGISTFACQVCAPTFIGTSLCVNNSSTSANISLKSATATNGGLIQHELNTNLFYLWNYDNAGILLGTNNNERLRFSADGVACFSCTVCVPNIKSTGTSGARYGTFNAPTNGGYVTFEAGGTPFGDIGSYCAQYGTGDATTLLLGSRTGYALSLGTSSNERLRIFSTGIACFSCQVCVTGNADTAAGLVINNGSGASGTCQHYINFTAGATTIVKMFRGNGVAGVTGGGLTIDNYDGMNIRLNQLGGSGGFLGISGGVTCFSSTICSPLFTGGVVNGTTICTSNGVIGNNSNNLYLSSNSTDGEISFWGNQLNTRLMTISGCGCVGIGTNTPSSTYGRLTVAGTGISIADDGNAKLQIGRYSSTACNAYIKMGANACSLRFTNNTDLSDLVTIDKGGNVGIGTTDLGPDGISLPTTFNYTWSEGSGNAYATLFRQRNSAATVVASGYKRSNTGPFASSYGISMARAAIAVGYNNGSIAFFSDAASNVANGTDISPTERMTITNVGVTCFSCQICVAGTTLPNDLFALNFLTMGG